MNNDLPITTSPGFTVLCGSRRELIVVPEGGMEVSTLIALRSAARRQHPAEHAAREDGTAIWPFEECWNPICVRIRELIQQLEALS